MVMYAKEAIGILAKHRGGAIAVCALGVASNEWWDATRAEDCFHMHGAMGFAASFALGLALALPNEKIWIINSDGSLCMNLGCLLTEAAKAPGNLKHFVIDNQVYQTVGALPMVNRGLTDYAGIARAAGIRNTRTIDNTADLDKELPRNRGGAGTELHGGAHRPRSQLSQYAAHELRRCRDEIPVWTGAGEASRHRDLRSLRILRSS